MQMLVLTLLTFKKVKLKFGHPVSVSITGTCLCLLLVSGVLRGVSGRKVTFPDFFPA